MKIRFLEEAQIELDEAIEFYQSERKGLGQTFLQEMLSVIRAHCQFSSGLASAF